MTASHKMDNSEDLSSSEKQENTSNKISKGGSRKVDMGKEKETQKKKIRDEKEENSSENLILELNNKLAVAEKEIKAQKEKYIRALAELENVRRRSEREKADIGRYCFENFFTDLLPVLDSFDKALSKEEEAEKELAANSFYTGIQLVSKQLIQNLEKNGLTQVKSLGEKFDPECHQAIQKNESSKIKEETVSEEYAKGYMLNGRLLRPAMVSVSVPTS